MRTPTYEELREMRQKEWERAQRRAEDLRIEERKRISAMPDVMNAPREGDPYAHPHVVCPCGGTNFVMERWVTVNGVRHRMQVMCDACGQSRVWDWNAPRTGDARYTGWIWPA